MKTEKYVAVKKIEGLNRILRAWIQLNRDFFGRTGDAAWWYNERASISILAAAAWNTGGVSLEEFSTRKRERGEKERAGRADIFFQIQRNRFLCEAKFLWLHLNAGDAIGQIKESLQEACADAKCLNRKLGQRFGVCFASVYTQEDTVRFDDAMLEKGLTELQLKLKTANFDAVAWCFPPETRKLREWWEQKIWQRGQWRKRIRRRFPGAVVIFSKCD